MDYRVVTQSRTYLKDSGAIGQSMFYLVLASNGEAYDRQVCSCGRAEDAEMICAALKRMPPTKAEPTGGIDDG